MKRTIDRREFIKRSAQTTAAVALAGCSGFQTARREPLYKISLAQWSLHKTIFGKKLDHLDFPAKTAELGINGVEYVNQFFKDKAEDEAYLGQLKTNAENAGVENLLIMIDGEGRLGDPDEAKRAQAVENHHRWVTAAKFLGCHSIRVNAASAGSYDEQSTLAADGLRRLTEFAAGHDINVIVENHGGLSSNGAWLAETITKVGHPRCGTLPDFGNFHVGGDQWYDHYKGVEETMPFAKAVSAKSYEFVSDVVTERKNNEGKTMISIDYRRMMGIVVAAGYKGFVGIEFEGKGPEVEGILKTKAVLELVRGELEAKTS